MAGKARRKHVMRCGADYGADIIRRSANVAPGDGRQRRGAALPLILNLRLRAAFWPQGLCAPISFCGKRGGLLGRRGICTPISFCGKRRWYSPEKSASPLPFAPANAPPEGEKLLPKEGIFLISTAVVQADSRSQYAKAARPFALCISSHRVSNALPRRNHGVFPSKSVAISVAQISHCGLY